MPHPRPRAYVALVGAGALLGSVLLPTVAAADDDAPTLTDLLISEYVEGTSNNKAVEIFNGTAGPIDLTGYRLEQYSNGNSSANPVLTLTGTVAAGEVHVLAHASAAPQILQVADQTTGTGLFNGDDALVLRGPGDRVVDSFGQVGRQQNFGTDVTLRRQADVCAGDTVVDDPWDRGGWDQFGVNTFDGLGSHEAGCAAGDPGDPGDPEPPPPAVGECGDAATPVGQVQGRGAQTPLLGRGVTVEGIVVGDFQEGGFNGYYVQDGGDDDPLTSDGVFVYAPGGAPVAEGDLVRVTGTAAEAFGMTQVADLRDVQVCATGQDLPEPVALDLPVEDHERYEGMLVTLPQDLAVLEFFNYARFGEIVVGTSRQQQPTAVHRPGSDAARALLEQNLSERITLDDGSSVQNPAVLTHPNGEPFTLDNRFRGGDLVTGATGVLDYRFSLWRLQPTRGAAVTPVNERPAVPQVGGTTTVASFNVLNYFTTLNSRGATTPEEFARQEAKIVAAITEMDAAVTGLIEIENNGDVALAALTRALNDQAGTPVWDYVTTGVVGTDQITTGYVYQPARVTPVGAPATLTEQEDPRFLDRYNRPALAQTFQDDGTGGQVTVINNHLKSKGSGCEAVGDPVDPDGQGNCNGVRTDAALALGEWAGADPTGTGADNVLIIGDLNSYDQEDPIVALAQAGFTDLLLRDVGQDAYTYVFDGMLGYLDYALANEALTARVTDAQAWSINADEPAVLDYTTRFKPPAQRQLYAPDAYRSSDHDPVLVGLDLSDQEPDTTPPTIEVLADPATVWPPNNRWVDVSTVVDAQDDSGEEPTVRLLGAETGGRGELRVLDDARFQVRAVLGARYTFTYRAVDAAGNAATEAATVTVRNPYGHGNPGGPR